MTEIHYYFATMSPYAYLAGTRAEAIAARQGATIRYRPLSLMALYGRTGGTPLPERHEARKAYRLQELRRQAAKAGLPINLTPLYAGANPAPSSYAIIAAQKAGGGDLGALVHGVLRACWAEERDIADDGVIRDCLSAAGFDPGLADSGLLSGAMAYEQNLEDAVEAGVFGVPTYAVGTELFWGQDRLEDLELYLEGKL